MTADQDWAAKAACRDDPSPDDWFVSATYEGQCRNRRAQTICNLGCPVKAECRAYYESLTPRQRAGTVSGGVVWNGDGRPRRLRPLPEPPPSTMRQKVERRRRSWRESQNRKRGVSSPQDVHLIMADSGQDVPT